MSRLSILEYPDPRLRTKALPVTSFDETLKRLIDDMFETMYAARGMGLAATQGDVHLQLITMDLSAERDAPQVYINPTILSRKNIGIVEESCLSLPGLLANVKRATHVRVRAHDSTGTLHDHELEGVPAVCLQHEMDHLDGRLFVDYLSVFARLRIRSRLALRPRRDAHSAAVSPHGESA